MKRLNDSDSRSPSYGGGGGFDQMEISPDGTLRWVQTVSCPRCGVGGLHVERRGGVTVLMAGPTRHVCKGRRVRIAPGGSGLVKRLLGIIAGLIIFCLPANAAEGIASWYGEELRGHQMANGKPFNPDALTAASWDFPLGTRVKVCHKNCTVFVTITDRGPARRLGRIIDLSQAAFKRLADTKMGLIRVVVSKSL